MNVALAAVGALILALSTPIILLGTGWGLWTGQWVPTRWAVAAFGLGTVMVLGGFA